MSNLKNSLATACLAVLLVAPAWSQRPDLITPLACDINGDGVMETVGIRPFVQEGVELGQLVLLDGQGEILWAGPASSASPAYPQEPDIFLGEFDLGDLEVAGDFAGQGKVMLLGTYQKSDVSPTRFRLFEWDGRGFRHLRSGNLLPEPQSATTFTWADDPAAARWVEGFSGLTESGQLKAEISQADGSEPATVDLLMRETEFVVTSPNP